MNKSGSKSGKNWKANSLFPELSSLKYCFVLKIQRHRILSTTIEYVNKVGTYAYFANFGKYFVYCELVKTSKPELSDVLVTS